MCGQSDFLSHLWRTKKHIIKKVSMNENENKQQGQLQIELPQDVAAVSDQ